MTDTMHRLVPVSQFAESDWLNENEKWIQLYPYDSWEHPVYGTTTIDKDVATTLKSNFDARVKDAHVFTDFEHGLDNAKGNKASGELVEVDVREDGLWGLVKFTAQARAEIDAGEWNYWSTSHYDTWTHPQSGDSFNYVLDGGGLTNKPWVKGMVPLNFSEIMIENPNLKSFAVWSTAYVNDLPNSSFLYVSGDVRKLPYKNKEGKIDLPHLRNAIARIPQMKGVSQDVKDRLQSRARALLAKSHAELMMEVAPEEFQEPGTGNIDPNINPDDTYPNRIDTPPPGEDGSIPDRPVTGGEMTTDEILAALREKLGLSDDVDIVAHVGSMNDELEPLRELKKEHSERKQFAETYPAEFERLQRLEAESRENFARTFSEKLVTRRFSRITDEKDDEGNAKTENTTVGLSAKAIEEVSEMVKKFGENTATLEDFSNVLDSIMDSGIVDYGNIGSTREPEVVATPKNSIEGRQMFSEKVKEIMENDKLDFDTALVEAAKKYPALYESWRAPVTVS